MSVPRTTKKPHITRTKSIVCGLAYNQANNATKRVLAPYVNIIRKGAKASVKREKHNKYFTFYLQQKPIIYNNNYTEFFDDSLELPALLIDTANTLRDATDATGVRLYLVDPSARDIYINPIRAGSRRNKIRWKIQEGASIAAHVAFHKTYVMVDDILGDHRFPDGIPYIGPIVKSVICIPVMTPEDECYAVLELYRHMHYDPFGKTDLRLALSVAGWMGISVYMNQDKVAKHRQHQLNRCLIELTKCYFADNDLLEKLMSEIVGYAKRTVNAQRATFYMIDPDSEELLADSYSGEVDDHSVKTSRKNTKMKFAKVLGVAGMVARTGESINIRDAYNDPKYSMEADPRTGFIARSILCVPVQGMEGILGVFEAINKLDGPCFTPADEKVLKTFSVFCSLTLHYAHTCQLNKRVDARCEVTDGLLKRHVKTCIREIKHILRHPHFYENPEALKEFTWYINLNYMDQMPQIAIHMILDMTGEECMDNLGLTKFILTVRNFYRNIPYHNWEHGFNVCHCMYTMLTRNRDIFTAREKKALMVATICHDIDHGGVTNNFLFLTNDVMSQLYQNSPWESHHYATTMLILSQINIYYDISAEEFKEVSEIMRHAIIATDLANYFPMRVKLAGALDSGDFDYNIPEHRNMMIAVMMNTCDLSGQCKPWPIVQRITKNVLEEFYIQGDIEKAMGNHPLSLMDRAQPEKIPYDQIMFMNALVLPCCDLLRKCLPNTGQLYDNAVKVKAYWLEVVKLINERCWKQSESVVPSSNKK